MTPFASGAMLEKLALLKIAFCRAPAFSSTSSACLGELTSPAPSETPIRVLVTSFPLAMVFASGNLYDAAQRSSGGFGALVTMRMRSVPLWICTKLTTTYRVTVPGDREPKRSASDLFGCAVKEQTMTIRPLAYLSHGSPVSGG